MNSLRCEDTENRLIAALLDDYMSTMEKVVGLTEEHFTGKRRRQILKGCNSLAESGQPIELISLKQEMHSEIALHELVEYSETHIPGSLFAIRDFEELERFRKLRVVYQMLHDQLRGINPTTTPSETIESLIEDLNALSEQTPVHRSDFRSQAGSWADDLCDRYDGKKPPGILTGYFELDKMTGGLAMGNLVVIGARAGVGKTTLALNIGWDMVRRGIPVGFISLEMKSTELIEKLVMLEGDIDGSELKRADIPKAVFDQAIQTKGKIENYPLNIIDDSQSYLASILTQARRLVRRQHAQVIIIDYLQLMESDRRAENRNNELSKITRAIKQFAQRENIVVILLSQLNRNAQGKGPKIHNLRDSGAIEQDANIVILIHDLDNKSNGKLAVAVAKNRSGMTGMFKLDFLGQYSRIQNEGLR